MLDLPERNRFSKGLFAWTGFRHTSVEFERRARVDGQTSWNYPRLFHFAINAVTSFSIMPLRETFSLAHRQSGQNSAGRIISVPTVGQHQFGQTDVLNASPISAVRAIANNPQHVTRAVAGNRFAPPVFAPIAPSRRDRPANTTKLRPRSHESNLGLPQQAA